MGGAPHHALTVAEAKARLREAAAEAGLTALVRHRPYATLALAVAAGAWLGGSPRARRTAADGLLRILTRAL